MKNASGRRLVNIRVQGLITSEVLQYEVIDQSLKIPPPYGLSVPNDVAHAGAVRERTFMIKVWNDPIRGGDNPNFRTCCVHCDEIASQAHHFARTPGLNK